MLSFLDAYIMFERQNVLFLVHNGRLRLTFFAFEEHNLSLQLSLETLDSFLAVLVVHVDVNFYFLTWLKS